jgi:hypothetical protein
MDLHAQSGKNSPSIPTYREYLMNRRDYLRRFIQATGVLVLTGAGVLSCTSKRKDPDKNVLQDSAAEKTQNPQDKPPVRKVGLARPPHGWPDHPAPAQPPRDTTKGNGKK